MQTRISKAAITTISAASRDSQTLQYKGRTLGFAEYGSPSGTPVFYFHGYPTSRLDGTGGHREAEIRNIRLICPDRPGYGLSTYQQDRNITDWPEDVEALANHLQLDRFMIIGGSGGGPYALACAKLIPHRLTAVGVFAGAPPWYTLPLPKPWYYTILRAAAFNAPGVLGSLFMRFVSLVKWLADTSYIASRLDAFREPLSREEFIRVLFEGFAQGPAAAVQETRLLSSDWGLKFEDIELEVVIWHGSKDTNAPVDYIRHMVKALPHARYQEFPEDDHYFIAKRFGEFLDELMPPSIRR